MSRGINVMEKGGFVLHLDYWTQLQRLSVEQRGELLTAIFAHLLSKNEPELDPATGMAYAFIIDRIDRDREKYLAKCEKLRENSGKGGAATKAKYSQMAPNGIVEGQIESKRTPIRTPTPNNTLFDKESIRADKPPAHARGEHGYVKLTDAEYEKLIADLGESEAHRVIAYVDESAAATGNKNKWKNWNLVLRKASREGWGKKYNEAVTKKPNCSAPVERVYSGAGFRENV